MICSSGFWRRHIRVSTICSFSALLLVLLNNTTFAADVDYVVQQARCAAKPCLHISVSFTSSGDGETLVRLPGDYAGSVGAELGVRELRAIGTASIVRAGSGDIKVAAKTGDRVTLHYALTPPETRDASSMLAGVYLPAIDTARARLLGWTAFVIPMLSPSTTRTASMTFRAADGAALTAYSNLGALGSVVEFAWHPMTIGTSVVLLGDYVSHAPSLGGGTRDSNRATLVVSGNEPARRDFKALAQDLMAVHGAIAQYWGSASTDVPLVYFGEIRDSSSSLKGSAFGAAFLTFATADRPRDGLTYLWMHELNHAWLPRKMLRQYGRRGADLYWFSEGFTEYVTHCLLEDGGFRAPGHLARELREAQKRLAAVTTPQPYLTLVQRFHSDQAAYKQVYDRGFLLAAVWDAEIRRGSAGVRSLRDALRSLVSDGAENRTVLDASTLEPVMTRAGVANFSQDVRRYVDQGNVPDLPTTLAH